MIESMGGKIIQVRPDGCDVLLYIEDPIQQYGDDSLFSPEDARALAKELLEAADAAEKEA